MKEITGHFGGNMGLIDKVRKIFTSSNENNSPMHPGATIPSRSGRPLNKQELREDWMDYNNEEYFGWRPITRAMYRDLTPLKHDRMLQIANYLWKSNALARRCIEIKKDLVLTEGFKVEASSDNEEARNKVQEVIDQHWRDNSWDKNLEQRIQDLLLFGEMIYYVAPPNKYNGRVNLGIMLPENIKGVQCDPFNCEEMDWLVTKMPIEIVSKENGVTTKIEQEKFKIVRQAPDGSFSGEVLYFAINKTTGSTRGLSDLIHVADWMDIFDKLLVSEAERVEFSKAFVYSCEVSGGEQAIDGVIERHKIPPRPGTILVHSDREKWKAIAPQLNLFDTVDMMKFIELLILGGMSIPSHWFIEGSANKTASTEMTAPVYNWARKMRSRICDFFTLLFKYVIQEAKKTTLKGLSDEDCEFLVTTIDPDRGNYDHIGDALSKLYMGLWQPAAVGWVAMDSAQKAFINIASRLGLSELEAGVLPKDFKPMVPSQTGTTIFPQAMETVAPEAPKPNQAILPKQNKTDRNEVPPGGLKDGNK